MGYYSKRHYRLLSNGGPDTEGAVAERVARRKAGEQAHKEMLAQFSPLTGENASEAIEWQEKRMKELMKEAGF